MTHIQTLALTAILLILVIAGACSNPITDPKQGTGFTVFGFIKVNFSTWPWQESDSHRQWRSWIERTPTDDKTFFLEREPPYKRGWQECGTAFYRRLGIQFTSRDLRFDLWYGIVWISWAPFKVKSSK